MRDIFKRTADSEEMSMKQQIVKASSLSEEAGLIEISNDMLANVRKELSSERTLCVPIAQLSTLGAGVSSLLPALNTVTQTTTVNTSGLFRLVNASVGDTLKKAKDNNFWAAFKKANGGSKFAKLQKVGPISATTKTVMPINPATMMMAVALASIEKKLDDIINMQKQILSFLECEKKAEIEADVETLVNIMSKYKHNWDNSSYLTSNHKLVIDIQRTARKNMIFYQKAANDQVGSDQLLTTQAQLSGDLKKLQDSFQYYRLSIYIYSLASLLEVMLSGNFAEENLSEVKDEIAHENEAYSKLFEACSSRLENNSVKSIETFLTKGFASAVKGLGGLIRSIPVISDGNVDEFLLENGSKIEESAKVMEGQFVEALSSLRNPGLASITDQLQTIRNVYNRTSGLYFDADNIYLTEACE